MMFFYYSVLVIRGTALLQHPGSSGAGCVQLVSAGKMHIESFRCLRPSSFYLFRRFMSNVSPTNLSSACCNSQKGVVCRASKGITRKPASRENKATLLSCYYLLFKSLKWAERILFSLVSRKELGEKGLG